jgi:hypothetical protein
METDFLTLIYNQGVAISMLVYFIFRFEKILKDNTESLKLLCTQVANCPNKRKI